MLSLSSLSYLRAYPQLHARHSSLLELSLLLTGRASRGKDHGNLRPPQRPREGAPSRAGDRGAEELDPDSLERARRSPGRTSCASAATDLDVSLLCGCAAQVSRQGGGHALRQEALRDRALAARQRRHTSRSKRTPGPGSAANAPSSASPACRARTSRACRRHAEDARSRSRRQLLTSLIQRTAFAITAEDARYYLAGALLVFDKDARDDGGDRRPSPRVGAAHERRRTRASRCERWCLARRSPRSRRLMEEVGPDEIVGFQSGESHLIFTVGGRTLVSKKVEAQFPAFEKVVAVTGDKKLVLGREAAAERHPPGEPALLGAGSRGAAVGRVRQAGGERLFARARRGARDRSGRLRRRRRPRSASTPSTWSSSCRSWAPTQVHVELEGCGEPGALPARGRRRRRLPLRRDAHAILKAVPLAWVERLAIRDLRNIHEATLELHPAVNVFHGRNAQGKTSLLEAVGLLARGRSFRTEHAASMIRSGAAALLAQARRGRAARVAETLEVELRPDGAALSPGRARGRARASTAAGWRSSSTRRTGCESSTARCASAGCTSTARPPPCGRPIRRSCAPSSGC